MPSIRRPSNYVPKHAKRSVQQLKQDLVKLREQMQQTRGQIDTIRGDYFGSMRMAIEDQLAIKDLEKKLGQLETHADALSKELTERGGKDPVERVGFSVIPSIDANIPGVVGMRVQAGVQRAIDRDTGKASWHMVGGALVEALHGEVGLAKGAEHQGIVALGSPMPFVEAGYNPLASGAVAGVHIPGVGAVGTSHTGHLEATIESPVFGPGLTVAVDHPKVRRAAQTATDQVRGAVERGTNKVRDGIRQAQAAKANKSDGFED